MIAALLMQIISLVPPAPENTVEPDLAYQRSVKLLAATESWSAEQCQQWIPKDPTQAASLANLICDGSDSEVRLSTVLAAGTISDSKLGRALWRRAALDFNEERVLACLLAPAMPSNNALPLIAWIAQDQRRSLAVRAAAIARLLDANCLAAWPMARRMLWTGTAVDKKTSIANWPRKGRYELPKRILLLSIQGLLKRRDLTSTDFEPNAPWVVQVEQVDKLNEIMSALEPTPPLPVDRMPQSWKRLLELKEAGNAEAIASFQLFREFAAELLKE